MHLQFPRIGGMDKSREELKERRDLLLRVGALAIGALAFVAAAQATVADDDDGGGGYYDDDDWGGYYDDDDWGGGYDDD